MSARLLCVAIVLVASACYGTTPCRPERCDGKDNDCDGVIDNGFVDGAGAYATAEHCGGCGVSCSEVFPGATATACRRGGGDRPRCVITACPRGERLNADGACVPDLSVQCMACEGHGDCQLFAPDSYCVTIGPDSNGEARCAMPCGAGRACESGFTCTSTALDGVQLCVSDTGNCDCSAAQLGAQFGCLLRNADGEACAGVQRCGSSGLGPCEAALEERCNGEDDDCDGETDEDFRDAAGRYANDEHCGGCGERCIAPGPFMDARCVAGGDGARCEATCQPEHVDVDGLLVTGCECRLMSGPGVVIGADADCDGVTDETPEFIFVAPAGDDANDGSQVDRPVRTLARAIERGLATSRNVLVARGIYAGPIDLAPGVSLLGGYSPDFRERDPALHQVLIEADPADPGAPVLRCTGMTAATRVEGLTLLGGDARGAGEGSTAVFLDKCGAEVVLADVTVVAGRGAAGLPGADSSAKLESLGFDSLAALAGEDGAAGDLGSDPALTCAAAAAGVGGVKMCPGGEASGGDGGAALCADLSTRCDNLADTPCGNAGCTDFTDPGGSCDLDAARAVAVVNPAAQSGRGEAPGAPGEAPFASPTNRGICNFCDDNPSLPRIGGDGGDGAPGSEGLAGGGCAGIELVDFSRGRASAGDGRDGTGGGDGSGGGGATAGAGFSRIGNTTGSCNDVAGGSGGGGGSGGCGAPGADGGGGGGSSLGVLIRLPDGATSGPVLKGVRVLTASGGDGGAGGIGAAGGPGGAGGLGGTSRFWCARDGGRGGDGGKGGDGGGGGGGCGGSSYGVYIAGDAADAYIEALRAGALIEQAGVAGRSGPGGFSPGAPGQSGTPGRSDPFAVVR